MMYMSRIPSNHRPRARAAYRRAAIAAVWLLAAVPLAGLAQSGNALPINIDANTANYSQQTGVSTYTGNVHMTRGGLTLTGNKLVVTRVNKSGNIKAVLTGSPAHIDKQPDSASAERLTGHADQVEYTNSNAQIVLRGDAVVNRGGDEVTGQVITHDIDTARTTAERGSGDNDRVHVTIQPESEPN